jgi:hypothetical protein
MKEALTAYLKATILEETSAFVCGYLAGGVQRLTITSLGCKSFGRGLITDSILPRFLRFIIASTSAIIMRNCGTEYSIFDGIARRYC